ncbi:MAG: hypothetical protein H7328_07180 [Bdellovibrio sp.]|nr:hypothetical protein [Bdellovibrio sp.]
MLDKIFEKKWLVKSENKILGPFHFEQIEDLLKKRQISLIDEIRDTETRWLYIRENPQFKMVVEEIRKEINSKNENTKTHQTVSKTITDVGQITSAQLPQFTEVDVQEASVIHEVRNEINFAKKLPEEALGTKEKAKIYGLPKDQFFQQKVDSSKRKNLIYLLIILVLFSLAAGSFVFYQKRSVRMQEEEWMAQIKKYEFLGFNQKAVTLYSKLPDMNQKKVLPQVLALYPVLETEHLAQLKDIENISEASDLSVEQKTTIQLIYFLAAMQNQNLAYSTEAIAKASALQPASDIVLENTAILDLKKSNFQASFDAYQSLYRKEKLGRYLLGSLQAFTGLVPAQKAKYLQPLSQMIEAHTSVYYDYKKELLLGQMALARWNKNDLLFKVSWSQFLNTPVQLSNLFRKSLLILSASYQWKELEEYKIAVRAALTPEEVTLFEIHNYLEMSQVSAAHQYSENNLAKIKEKAVKQQMTLLILNSQARRTEILALEKTGQLDMKSELNHILLALIKIELNPASDISIHIDYLKDHKLVFCQDWITLVQLTKSKQLEKIKPFLREHLMTVDNFAPVIEARSLVE